MFLSKGFTYLESVVAMAIIGICTMILAVSFRTREIYRQTAGYQTIAIVALTSQADLIRGGTAPRESGRHSFIHSDALLKGLPGANAYYKVGTMPEVAGLLRITLEVHWLDRGTKQRALEIYVRQ